MTSISDKLKSLGVKVGTQEIVSSPKRRQQAIEDALSGQIIQTPLGETLVVEETYLVGQKHGRFEINLNSSLHNLAAWAGDQRIAQFNGQDFAFIDTETTGLSGGTGTYAFLIGVGRFMGEAFKLYQFFMRDPIEEPAQLYALEEYLAPCSGIVSYNGKAFDVPLINSRFTVHGLISPLSSLAHIDLLHLARRLWADRLPSRTLGNIEASILNTIRTEEDVPGWMIPQMYFDYLRGGDTAPLKRILYHNAMDIVSLAVLLNRGAALLSNPLETSANNPVDLIALGKLFESIGDNHLAVRLYIHGLHHDDVKSGNIPPNIFLQGLQRLGLIYKRSANYEAAIEVWRQAARHKHIESHIELAKYYEHTAKNFASAIDWTERAINMVQNSTDLPEFTRRNWLEALEYRLSRLQRKNSKS